MTRGSLLSAASRRGRLAALALALLFLLTSVVPWRTTVANDQLATDPGAPSPSVTLEPSPSHAPESLPAPPQPAADGDPAA
mgnify:CR=1 FL=1